MQDLRDRLADLLQGRRPLSEERSEAMREALGQGLGLVLCVTALNRTLMLRLLAARLGLGSPQENAQPLPARHWAQVLVRPCAICYLSFRTFVLAWTRSFSSLQWEASCTWHLSVQCIMCAACQPEMHVCRMGWT